MTIARSKGYSPRKPTSNLPSKCPSNNCYRRSLHQSLRQIPSPSQKSPSKEPKSPSRPPTQPPNKMPLQIYSPAMSESAFHSAPIPDQPDTRRKRRAAQLGSQSCSDFHAGHFCSKQQAVARQISKSAFQVPDTATSNEIQTSAPSTSHPT